MTLFRNYVPTKNKGCLLPFKGKSADELMTLDQVKGLPEYAGILADDTILIDIDEFELSEIMMNIVEGLDLRCRVYETSRGKHFVFKNEQRQQDTNKTHARLACGLTADIKVGHRNSYEILKFEGKDRPIIYDILDGEEYQEIPKWMLPVQSKTNFLKLGEGTGRNQELFNYILTLQSADYSVEEVRQTIEIINQYVLPEPLDQEEMDKILRDDSFNKPLFFKKGQFLFDVFAKYLKNNHHIKLINGLLHIYHGGIYVSGKRFIQSAMIKHIPTLNSAKRSEVQSYLELLCEEESQLAPANFIAFKNGIYDLDTGELSDFSPEKVITNKIPFDYVEGAYDALTDKTLNKLACQDPEIRALLEELIGYTFYRRAEMRASFLLTGDRQNGKSTFLAMLENLLGKANIAALDLAELGDRFKTVKLVNCLANIGDDIGSEFIANPAIFKKLSSGNPVTIERKGVDAEDFSNYAKLIFSANEIPRIRDKTGAVLSRLIIIPFDARFTKEDPDFDPYIKYKLLRREAMEYLIQIGLNGLRRILENQGFTTSHKVERSLQEYDEENNPILLFLKEDTKIEDESCKVVYQNYSEFCMMNKYTPLSNIEFSKQITKRLGLKTVNKRVNKKQTRVFVAKEGDGDE